MTDRVHDVVVVGGGVGGMAAAWALRDRDVLLLEASDRLGGRLLSHARDPYWLNLGGHLFPGPGTAVGDMVDALGLRAIEIPGSKFDLVWDGKVHSRRRVELYPLTLRMSVRERIAFADTGMRILRVVGRWRRAQSQGGTVPLRDRQGSPATFRSIVGRPPHRVAAVFETAARRSSTEVDDQSAESAGQLFAAVWAGKKSALANNLVGGSGRLAEELTKRMGDSIVFRSEVTSIEDDGDVLVVTVSRSGRTEQVRSRSVILATPASVAAHLGTALPEEVRSCLSSVSYGTFVSMAALTSETSSSPFDDMYAVTTPGCSFDMLFNHANPLRGGAIREPGGSLMVYAGGDRGREMLDWPEEKVSETFVADILRLFPHLEGKVVETIVQKWPIGLSYRRPGSDLTPLRRFAAGATRLQLCGDYFGDLGNMEIAAGSGAAAAQRVIEGLEA
jgi:protoporphyrinogen/coproporphyrinogen III oxidase